MIAVEALLEEDVDEHHVDQRDRDQAEVTGPEQGSDDERTTVAIARVPVVITVAH